MADVTVAGVGARAGHMTLRLNGAWRAEFELANTEDKTGQVEVVLAGQTFIGTVKTWATDAGGDSRVVVIGGANKLNTFVAAKAYLETPLRQVVESILREVGEELDESSAPMEETPRHWVTVEGAASTALKSVLPEEYHYRTLPNGKVFVGPETWPEVPAGDNEAEVTIDTKKTIDVYVSTGNLLPGQVHFNKNISEVTYILTEDSLKARLSYEEGVGGLQEQLETFIWRQMSTPLRNCTCFRYTIHSQNADGTLNLQAENLPELLRVPMAIAGVSSIRVLAGSSAYVIFEDGTSTNPTVIGLSSGAVQSTSSQATDMSIQAASFILDAPDIQVGGTKPLVTFEDLVVWMAQLQVQNAGLGLSVPPFTKFTLKLKGG